MTRIAPGPFNYFNALSASTHRPPKVKGVYKCVKSILYEGRRCIVDYVGSGHLRTRIDCHVRNGRCSEFLWKEVADSRRRRFEQRHIDLHRAAGTLRNIRNAVAGGPKIQRATQPMFSRRIGTWIGGLHPAVTVGCVIVALAAAGVLYWWFVHSDTNGRTRRNTTAVGDGVKPHHPLRSQGADRQS